MTMVCLGAKGFSLGREAGAVMNTVLNDSKEGQVPVMADPGTCCCVEVTASYCIKSGWEERRGMVIECTVRVSAKPIISSR